MDVIESNEAFAVQALRRLLRPQASTRRRSTPTAARSRLGHPIGATGALLTVKAIYELQRTGGSYALVTMCIGGGQGIAAIFEQEYEERRGRSLRKVDYFYVMVANTPGQGAKVLSGLATKGVNCWFREPRAGDVASST